MALVTRGSASLEKAQRRLALLKAINSNLDLGHGLSIATYTQLIATTRTALEAYNTLLSNVDESRTTLTQLEQSLSELSTRMLGGVAARYGKNSTEYAKAGGSNRRKGKHSTTEVSVTPATGTLEPAQVASATVLNGAVTQPASN